MSFKESPLQFQMIDVSLIEADDASARQNIDEASLKGLANSIQQKGLIHPLVVLPANAAGRHVLIVGERRWRAAVPTPEAGGPYTIELSDGERLTLGDVLIGEVSTVNDDLTDNVFREPIGRFAEIEEDEAPWHLLVSDYDHWLG